jgi:putative oxidoreductase
MAHTGYVPDSSVSPDRPERVVTTRKRPSGLNALFRRLVHTREDAVPFVLRVTLALVMFPHGAQKLLGWFGGLGFERTIAAMGSGLGLPPWVTVLIMITEFFGSIALLLGVLTRLAALGIAALMVGAIAMVHAQHGFFMNWFGAQQGEGFEYHLLALGSALALIIGGGGALSVDHAFRTREIPRSSAHGRD